MSGGWNPITGRDSTGTRPAGPPAGAPVASQGQPYIPHFGTGPGYNFNAAGAATPQFAYPAPYTNAMYGSAMPFYPPNQAALPYILPFQQGAPTAGFQAQQTFSHQPNGTGNVLPRQPGPYPNIDPAMPAAQMTNSSGGVGCEPGYNYFFPKAHTKVHVFKTDTPPWQLPDRTQIPFIATHVPCNTRLGELLKGFGCTNSTAKKNKCFEIVDGGNGKWYKGFGFGGDEKDVLKMCMTDVGWDETRSGNDGEKPIVCLWFCKN